MPAEASPTQGPPVDFYAGVIATVMVLLFAKFVTHRNLAQDHKWKWLAGFDRKWWHVACVVTAWLSLMVSLSVLGLLPDGPSEVGARLLVLLLVAFASTIFALDVVSLDVRRADGKTVEEVGRSPDELRTEPE